MTEVHCDVCGKTIGDQPKLSAMIDGVENKAVHRLVKIETVPGENDGDVCADCTLDALYLLRTPKPKPKAVAVDPLNPLGQVLFPGEDAPIIPAEVPGQ